MKHDKLGRIWWSILFNVVFIVLVWLTFQSHMWAYNNDTTDVFLKLFAISGMIAVLYFINYAIELTTRIKDGKDDQNSN